MRVKISVSTVFRFKTLAIGRTMSEQYLKCTNLFHYDEVSNLNVGTLHLDFTLKRKRISSSKEQHTRLQLLIGKV